MRNRPVIFSFLGAILLVLQPAFFASAMAQETVTIPRTRLQELERQAEENVRLKKALEAAERELARLKGSPASSRDRSSGAAAEVSTVPRRSTPPMAQLAPIADGELVNAVDLMNHYRQDPVAADQRYRKRRFKIQGEVLRLERPLLVSHYVLLIRMEDARDRFVCEVDQPEQFKTTFTVKNGEEMVGTLPNGARVPLVKLGQTVVLEGRCKGLKDGGIVFEGAALKSVQ